MKNSNKLIEFLAKTNHSEITSEINSLNSDQLAHLLEDIDDFSKRPLLDLHYSNNPPPPPPPFEDITPLEPNKEDTLLADQALSKGEVQTLILAGGDGSRLKFDQPKALFPLPYKGGQKRLIDFFLDKLPAAFPLMLLVSKWGLPFLSKALKGKNVSFLIQNNLPFLSHDFKWQIKEDGHLLQGPDGNGGLLDVLPLKALKEKGVRYIEILPIDNPLLCPLDPLLLGAHIRYQNDITAKCFQTQDKNEPVGRFAKKGDKTYIIDYTMGHVASHLSFANINHMVVSLSFLEKIGNPLKLHWVKKEMLFKNKPLAVYKAERFITDIFEHAKRVSLLLVSKESSFYPIKSLEDLVNRHLA